MKLVPDYSLPLVNTCSCRSRVSLSWSPNLFLSGSQRMHGVFLCRLPWLLSVLNCQNTFHYSESNNSWVITTNNIEIWLCGLSVGPLPNWLWYQRKSLYFKRLISELGVNLIHNGCQLLRSRWNGVELTQPFKLRHQHYNQSPYWLEKSFFFPSKMKKLTIWLGVSRWCH